MALTSRSEGRVGSPTLSRAAAQCPWMEVVGEDVTHLAAVVLGLKLAVWLGGVPAAKRAASMAEGPRRPRA